MNLLLLMVSTASIHLINKCRHAPGWILFGFHQLLTLAVTTFAHIKFSLLIENYLAWGSSFRKKKIKKIQLWLFLRLSLLFFFLFFFIYLIQRLLILAKDLKGPFIPPAIHQELHPTRNTKKFNKKNSQSRQSSTFSKMAPQIQPSLD